MQVVHDVSEMQTSFSLFQRLVFPQKGLDPFMVRLWRIDAADHFPVSRDEPLVTHLWNDVSGKVRIVTGDILSQPSFLPESFVKPATPRRIKHAHHCSDDPAFLDEPDLPCERLGRVIVKPDDKTPSNTEAELLYPLYSCEKVPVPVLEFIALLKGAVVGSFNADEHALEPRLNHLSYQVFVVSEVD